MIRGNAEARQIFKTWSLSKANFYALFQAAETWFVGAFNTIPATSFKAALDAVSATTANQARWFGKIWFMWRIGHYGPTRVVPVAVLVPVVTFMVFEFWFKVPLPKGPLEVLLGF